MAFKLNPFSKQQDMVNSAPDNKENFQLTAFSETLRGFRALASGRVVAVSAETGTAAAAGESMTFDVQIKGVSCLSHVITINSSTAIDTPVAGVINPAKMRFAVGDLVSIVRVYTPGSTPTPMRDTVLGYQVKYDS